jgi:hypothetical protein
LFGQALLDLLMAYGVSVNLEDYFVVAGNHVVVGW